MFDSNVTFVVALDPHVDLVVVSWSHAHTMGSGSTTAYIIYYNQWSCTTLVPPA